MCTTCGCGGHDAVLDGKTAFRFLIPVSSRVRAPRH